MNFLENKWFNRIFLTICWILLVLAIVVFVFGGSFLFALFVKEIS